jgi:YVTN family beta-propeller protein
MRYFRLVNCFLRLLILGALFGMGGAYAAPSGYISNYESGTVSVIDTATNIVVATVPVGTIAQAAHPHSPKIRSCCVQGFVG